MDVSKYAALFMKAQALRFDPVRSAQDEARLLEHLHDRDVRCPLCGYNLRNLTQPTCPECHHKLSLTVGVTEVPLLAFIAAIVPGVFSGMTAAFMLVPIFLSQRTAGGANVPWFIVVIDVFGFLSGLIAAAMIHRRRSFLALPQGVQRRAALLIWLVHILVAAFLFSMVFGGF